MDTELWWKHCIWTVCRISVGTSAFILYTFQIKQFCLRASVFPCCKILLISHLTLFCLCNARGFWIKTLVLPCWIRWKSPSYPSFLSSLVTSSRCLGKHTVIIPSVYLPAICGFGESEAVSFWFFFHKHTWESLLFLFVFIVWKNTASF